MLHSPKNKKKKVHRGNSTWKRFFYSFVERGSSTSTERWQEARSQDNRDVAGLNGTWRVIKRSRTDSKSRVDRSARSPVMLAITESLAWRAKATRQRSKVGPFTEESAPSPVHPLVHWMLADSPGATCPAASKYSYPASGLCSKRDRDSSWACTMCRCRPTACTQRNARLPCTLELTSSIKYSKAQVTS